MSTKYRCVDSWKSHVRLNNFDIFSPVYFISHIVIYTIHRVIFRLRESHNNCASTMKSVMTFSIILSKCHTITIALYFIIYASYYIHFRVQHTIRRSSACCILAYIFKIFFRVHFALAWPSWSTYNRVVDDGIPMSIKHRRVDSQKSHVRLNTFDRCGPLYFISHLVIYTIYHVIFRLRESHSNCASTMISEMTLSILSKYHTITTASYAIIYATY